MSVFLLTFLVILVIRLRSSVVTLKEYRRLPSKGITFNSTLALEVMGQTELECGCACALDGNCHNFCSETTATSAMCFINGVVTNDGGSLHGRLCYAATCQLVKGYSFLGPYCLKFNSVDMTYFEAKESCATDGAHLYHMKTLDDKDILSDLLSSTPSLLWNWVGADDLAVEGTFVWSDGTPFPAVSAVWGSPPDNWGVSGEDCIMTWDPDMLLSQ